jgi:simple sugar transport system ATP-binding protein
VPRLEARRITKRFGTIEALVDVDVVVRPGLVTCLLGDNGAGKSTLIKVFSGVHAPDSGELLCEGKPCLLSSPREALDLGIATVYQDLAMVPLMSIWRNFFLGREPVKGVGPTRRLRISEARRITSEELSKIGIEGRDPDQMVGTLSGGERQAVAIARAVYWGARTLILDEPTSALGVREASVVLRYILQAKARNLGIVFITHNLHHAHAIGDHFVVLNRGRLAGTYDRGSITIDELGTLMAGGQEMEQLADMVAEVDGADRELVRR